MLLSPIVSIGIPAAAEGVATSAVRHPEGAGGHLFALILRVENCLEANMKVDHKGSM